MGKPTVSLNPVVKHALSVLLATAVITGIAFASTIRERVTRLEAAFVEMHDDVKELKADVKVLISRKR